MRSMTGYGRGESERDGAKICVEVNSVNRKQSDIVINLPRELSALEPRVRHRPRQTHDSRLHAVAGKQKVDVDRVTRAVLYRACSRGQHLGEQLAAEDPGPEVLDAARFEAIVAERFGVEPVEERLERAGHMRARLPYPKRRVKARARGAGDETSG